MRLFHVQNAPWATQYLLRKFNINARDDLVGTDFGRYIKPKRSEPQGRKPLLSGKTWNTQHDPWRGISRTALGMDYLKPYPVQNRASKPEFKSKACKMFELNCFNAEDNPEYGYDVYTQRLGCYIQHKEAPSEIPNDPDIGNPYHEDPNKDQNPYEYVPHLETLDNQNAIIIFENSQSGSIEDTMIAARKQWESRWRRLPFYLAFETHDDLEDDGALALQCMRLILNDLFKCATESWKELLDISSSHVSILEDKIYEQPADESRGPELWQNAASWLKVERLMFTHMNVVRELQANLRELTEEAGTNEIWLEDAPADFEGLSNRIQEDLVKPTANLNDLMYKSVEIRDSRHSLQLSMSMWRLSWISFLCLPLTVVSIAVSSNHGLLLTLDAFCYQVCSFFGMNGQCLYNNTVDPHSSSHLHS